MTTEREDLVRHELKTPLQSTDGAASTFEVLFASNPFNPVPDPGAGTARVLVADNAVLANATKWEILTIDARAINGASDGYVLTVAARNEKSVDGNPQDFSAGAVLFQTPTTLDLAEYLALSGGTMTGNLDMGSNNVSNIGTLDVDGAATFNSSVDVAGMHTIEGNPGTTLQVINRTSVGTVEQKWQNNDNSLYFGMDGSNEAFFMATASGGLSNLIATFPRTGGINFGQSNLSRFDDWGSFTPTLLGNTTAGSHTYTDQVGRWARAQDILFWAARIGISSVDTGWGGSLRMGGLPVAVTNAPSAAFGLTPAYLQHIQFPAGYPMWTVVGTEIWFRDYDLSSTGSSTSNISVANVGSSPVFRAFGFYSVE